MFTSTPHFAKNVFFSCIDDRLSNAHAEFIKNIGGAFAIAIAGGGLALLSPDDRKVALKEIALAYMINKIDHVYLESHMECGAYKFAGVHFNDPEQELECLYSDLDKAAAAVRTELLRAGAKSDEVEVTVRVVDTDGHVVQRAKTLQPQA
ncbi:MAG TPA: hypothetical protein VGS28_04855 [Candidatus Saccharimonadales bacterium]|nr:hypothetical protein [Candidatus Saccharimonadales bacterium]